MSDTIIAVENLGKKYRIQHQQQGRKYVALRDVIAQKITAPFRWLRATTRPQVHGQQDQSSGGPVVSSPRTEDFWVLKDVSFEVRQGEVVGIIGRNGAGKSTLLKILSRITEPTTGRIHIKGRVASLLEVGTGFHPELTGRENIFLNGAILGMHRVEINTKFDEIVAFAEVEKFLDTPVKHYSSGMYVRLAFAVAAHLEPEILIVDEVLAVGDAEFQKKCLGKMESVSRKEGRTVLFVSHNMAAVRSLTTRGMVLNAGRMVFNGSSAAAIEHYEQFGNPEKGSDAVRFPSGRGQHTKIIHTCLLDGSNKPTKIYSSGDPFRLEVQFETNGASGLSLEVFLLDANRHNIAVASLHHFQGAVLPTKPGIYRSLLTFQPLLLASGPYTVNLTTSVPNSSWDHYVEDALEFSVNYSNPGGQSWDFKQMAGYGSFAMLCTAAPQFVRCRPAGEAVGTLPA
jgi:lipopolysaccharide transport system ATP-binding protein